MPTINLWSAKHWRERLSSISRVEQLVGLLRTPGARVMLARLWSARDPRERDPGLESAIADLQSMLDTVADLPGFELLVAEFARRIDPQLTDDFRLVAVLEGMRTHEESHALTDLIAVLITAAGLIHGMARAERLPDTRPPFDERPPPDFPSTVTIHRQRRASWANTFSEPATWMAHPRSTREVVAIVNWAARGGHCVRAGGCHHNWSPLHAAGPRIEHTVIIDLGRSKGLLDLDCRDPEHMRARFSAGVTLERASAELEAVGLAFSSMPAAGHLTLGGIMAVGGHGSGVDCPGSFAQLVTEFVAVVGQSELESSRYIARRFVRDRDNYTFASDLVVHLGRSIVTELCLRVVAGDHLREHREYPDVDRLLAPRSDHQRGPRDDFAERVRTSTATELIAFPFGSDPHRDDGHNPALLKTWQRSPRYLPTNTEAYASARLENSVSPTISAAMAHGYTELAPWAVRRQSPMFMRGMQMLDVQDRLGTRRAQSLYVQSTTLRMPVMGYALCMPGQHLQSIAHELWQELAVRLAEHAERQDFPINGPVEFRVTPVDVADPELGAPPSLSPCVADPGSGHELCLWFNVLGFPVETTYTFLQDYESWLWRSFGPGNSRGIGLRPEWSKGFGYGPRGPWTELPRLRPLIAESFPQFERACRNLDRYDPAGVYWSPISRQLFAPNDSLALVRATDGVG